MASTTNSISTSQGPAQPSVQPAVQERYLTLDAFRGFVMIFLCTEGFGLSFLQIERIARQFQHLRWDGFVIWENVMPSFMFMVGFSLPFALEHRRAKGLSFGKTFRGVVGRVIRLALLGGILYSLHAGHYHADPIETLTQLGLSYLVCFLILQLDSRWKQAVAAAGLMALNWGLYVLFPGPSGPFDPTINVGIRVDRALFGIDHAYDWQTMNFLGSAVTVLFGAWSCQLLRSSRAPRSKAQILLGAIVASLVAGFLLLPINPVIHKCWTATFTFFHTAVVLTELLVLFGLIELLGVRKFALPWKIVGVNSIFIYLVNGMMKGWLDRSVGTFTAHYEFLGPLGPVAQIWTVVLVMWYLCYWLYQRKIFFKV